MSKSSIKTKTVLTMTDMTESTELLAFKRQKDGYKVTVKFFLCICVVPSRDELKVRQNLLDSDYGIYMMCLLVATVYWNKSRQFVKKSNMTLSPYLFMIVFAVSMIKLCSTKRWVFFPSFHIYKKPPRITVFRKLKCPDPSMIPLPAEVKECLQMSIPLTSYILI